MSMRANPMAIGAFVLGAAGLLVVALLVWGGTGLFRTRLDYVMYFDSAVTGLSKGAPVQARGVKVGEVRDIQIRWGTSLIGVYVALDPEAVKGAATVGPALAIEEAVRQRGLRAQLRMQSLVTGVLYVALDERSDTPIVLHHLDPRVPELPTIRTDLEVWTAKLEKLASAIEKVPLEQIAQSTAAILEDVRRIVASKEAQDLLPSAYTAIGAVRTLVQRVDRQVDPLFAGLSSTLAQVDRTLDAVRTLALDVDTRIDPLATQAEATLKTAQATIGDARPLIADVRGLVAKLDAQADPLLTSFRGTSDTARGTLERAQLALASVDRTLEQESPLGVELFQTLRELRVAAQAVGSLADYLERVPDAPVHGLRRPRAEGK